MSVFLNKQQLQDTLEKASYEGGWADFATYCGGEWDSGDEELDKAIQELYNANEKVHLIANKLALRYDLEYF